MDAETTNRIEGLVDAAAKRHDDWALEPDAASDCERLECGMTLYKPTLPHVWAIARISQMLKKDPYGLNLVLAWLLAHDQKTVRNEIMPQLRRLPAEELAAKAEEWLMDAGASPAEVLPVVARFTQEAFGAKKKETGTETA